jgi:hypothetical protein
MDFKRDFEIVSLSCLRAYKKFGICSSRIYISSEEGFKVPPEIIEK